MKKISFLGVLIGGIVDVLMTNILAIPLILYILLTNTQFLGMSQEEMMQGLTQVLQSNWILFTLQLLIGSFCSMLGGYLAAYIARHDELLNGALSAYLCFAIGIYSVVRGFGTESVILTILGFILSPALGLLGGYLRLLQKKATRSRAPQVVTA